MKKFTKLFAIAILVVMTLTLAGCSLEKKFEGKWKGEMKEDGIGFDVEMEFKDGEVTIELEFMGETEKETSDYEIDGKELIIDDEKVEYEFDGNNKLTLELEDGVTLELERDK